MILMHVLASRPPPLRQPPKLTGSKPYSVRRTSIENHSAPSREILPAHHFTAERALAIDDLTIELKLL